jgi:hypothetical protein
MKQLKTFFREHRKGIRMIASSLAIAICMEATVWGVCCLVRRAGYRDGYQAGLKAAVATKEVSK